MQTRQEINMSINNNHCGPGAHTDVTGFFIGGFRRNSQLFRKSQSALHTLWSQIDSFISHLSGGNNGPTK